jgi:hypothetical protein
MSSDNQVTKENSEKTKNGAAQVQSEAPSAHKGMGLAFFLFGAAYVVGTVLQHLVVRMNGLLSAPQRSISVDLGLILFIVVLAAGFAPKWHRFLSSNRFAVPALVLITLFSIIGTLIPQTTSVSAPMGAHRQTWIELLCVNDIFHSVGFSSILGMGAGGLALVLVRKRRFTLRYAGSVGAHLGVLFILAGASIGIVWGVKGRLNLHVGESSDRFAIETENGGTRELPLGFSVSLDDFRVLHYERELDLMVYDVSQEREKKLLSANPVLAQDLQKLKAYGVDAVSYFPDYAQEWEVAQDSGDSGIAALGLTQQQQKGVVWLFDDRSGNSQADAPQDVKFFWEAARAHQFLETNRTGDASAEHILSIGGKEIAVKPGGSYPIPGTDQHVEVKRAFLDFVMDQNTKEPTERSDQPNNPALEVEVKDAKNVSVGKSWLFANYPDFHGMKNELSRVKITYQYRAAGSVSNVRAIIVGQRQELWRLEQGLVKSTSNLEQGRPLPEPFEKFTVHALYPAVRRSLRDINRSDKPNNPVALVRVSGQSRTLSITPREPLRLAEDNVLVLAPKGGDTVRDYVSLLSVTTEGHKVLSSTVEVNHPLTYRGFSFFQSDYRPEDLTFSGFQVVRDPGLWIVYLGLILNASGVIGALLLPPLLRRRKLAAGKTGGGA